MIGLWEYWFNNNIQFVISDPNEDLTLGIQTCKIDIYDKDGDYESTGTMICLGFLVFNLNFYI